VRGVGEKVDQVILEKKAGHKGNLRGNYGQDER
jgi:hypothetical protein